MKCNTCEYYINSKCSQKAKEGLKKVKSCWAYKQKKIKTEKDELRDITKSAFKFLETRKTLKRR